MEPDVNPPNIAIESRPMQTCLSLSIPDIIMEAQGGKGDNSERTHQRKDRRRDGHKTKDKLRAAGCTHLTMAPIQNFSRQIEPCVLEYQYLCDQLNCVLNENPLIGDSGRVSANAEPITQPLLWVYRCLKRNGSADFCYQLSNNSTGMIFTDKTQLLLLPNNRQVCIIDSVGVQAKVNITAHPASVSEKMSKLLNFKSCMENYLPMLAPGRANNLHFNSTQAQLPYLHTYFHSSKHVGMLLSNGTMQINYSDGTAILLSAQTSSVTYIDQGQRLTTYRLLNIARQGCSEDMYDKLCGARGMLETLLVTVIYKT